MKSQLIISVFLICLSFVNPVFSLEEKQASTSAKFKFINDTEDGLIFIKLRRALVTKVTPRDAQIAKFGIAEYYFKHNDFSDAFRAFQEYERNYSPGESTLLAKVFLYKIALIKKDADLASSLKKELFDNSFILLFSKFKILKYRSAFNNNYEIHYYLDKIKIFLNGDLFEELNP